MKRFIPREKMSKKARKELDAQQRATWQYSPVTKKIDSKKLYNRKKRSHDRLDNGMGSLLFWVYSVTRSRATATSLTLVPVGPVKISPPMGLSAL